MTNARLTDEFTLALLAVLVLVTLGFALDAYLNRRGRVRYRKYKRFQVGMTGVRFPQ